MATKAAKGTKQVAPAETAERLMEEGNALKLELALNTLPAIVEATNNNGSIYTAPAIHEPLIAAGLVEINAAYTNVQGEIATRATKQGVERIMSESNVAPAPAPAATGKASFEVVTGIEIPGAKRRGGKGGNVYPFETMEVGASFFVAATTDKPEPAKSLASTVSSATARFAVEVKDETGATVMENHKVVQYQLDEAGKRVKGADGKLVKLGETTETRPKMATTKEFTIRAIEDGAAWGFTGIKGAGIWRVK